MRACTLFAVVLAFVSGCLIASLVVLLRQREAADSLLERATRSLVAPEIAQHRDWVRAGRQRLLARQGGGQSGQALTVGLVFFEAEQSEQLLQSFSSPLEVATLSSLAKSTVSLRRLDVTTDEDDVDVLLVNLQCDWRPLAARLLGSEAADAPVERLLHWLRQRHTASHLIGYSALPPPLAPALREVASSGALRALLDSSVLYHPWSFWSFLQHADATPAPAPTPSRPGVAVLCLVDDKPGARLQHWLLRVERQLSAAGVPVQRYDGEQAAPRALEHRLLLLVDAVACDGHATHWLPRALADSGRVVAYLGGRNVRFFFDGASNLIDARDARQPAALVRRLLAGDQDSRRRRRDTGAHRFTVTDALRDVASVFAWKRLLDPMPALAPFPARLLATCTAYDDDDDLLLSTALDSNDDDARLSFTVFNAGDPLEPADDEIEEYTGSSCLHPSVERCRFVSQRSALASADAVFVHERVAESLPSGVLPWQPVVVHTMESPLNDHFAVLRRAHTKATFTSSYRLDADVPLSYLWQPWAIFEPKSTTVAAAARRAPVFWAASHCVGWRDRLMAQLMKYVSVDAYGQCLNTAGRDEPSQRLYQHYPFTMGVENTICEDYITEKLWNPLVAGSVPVYYGAPNALDYAPTTHSVVMLDRFVSAQHAAEWLARLASADHADAHRYFLAHRDPAASVPARLGFHYYVFLTSPSCPRRLLTCNLLAKHHHELRAARRLQTAFNHRLLGAPLRCDFSNEVVSPTSLFV